MRIVIDTGSDSPVAVLAVLDEFDDAISVHSVQLAHQLHGRQRPVDARHSQVFSHAEFIVVFVGTVGGQEIGMLGQQNAAHLLFGQDNVVGDQGLERRVAT